MKNGMLLTITGPSGSGKTELMKELCENHNFSKLVSVTTRPMRSGEVEGEDYYFCSESDFNDLEKDDGLVQMATFNGHRYGTTVTELARVAALGKIPAVIVEPGGLPQFRDISKTEGYEMQAIFITANFETLVSRYLQRIHGEKDATRVPYHAKRIAAIINELEWRHCWNFRYRLFNDGTDKADVGRLAEFLGENIGKS